jgi:hypothetical protein
MPSGWVVALGVGVPSFIDCFEHRKSLVLAMTAYSDENKVQDAMSQRFPQCTKYVKLMVTAFSLIKWTFQCHQHLFMLIHLYRVPELEVEEETQVQEMTLDEWKNLQEQTRPKPEFNIRKPESSVPSKAVVIHKSKYRDDVSIPFPVGDNCAVTLLWTADLPVVFRAEHRC